MRVLVVDDSRVARAVLRKVLAEIGYSVVAEAADGEEALVKLGQATFDLVITDWTMPHMDGIALVRAIRHSPHLDVPVLMISGETYTERFLDVIRAGAQAYLAKPFTAIALRQKIAEVIKKQAMQIGQHSEAAISGRLAEIGFPELVQFVSSCSLSGRLVIGHEESGVALRGEIDVRSGEVVAAYCGASTGDDAVYEMAEWEEGTFAFEPSTEEFDTNTSMPTLTLLVEAMKLRDERART